MMFSKVQFILLNSVLLAVMIISGAFLDLFTRLFLTSILLLFCSVFLLDKTPFSKTTSFCVVFLPILLIYGGGYIYDLIYDEGFIGKPFFWSYLLIAVLVYASVTYRVSKKKIVLFFIPFCLLLTIYVYYTSVENNKWRIEFSHLEKVRFADKEGNEYALNMFKGKLTVFEFWTIYCPNCPESMSKFQSLADEYKSDMRVDFKLVNVQVGTDKKINRIEKMEDPFYLNKFYTDNELFTQLNFNTVPAVLVIDSQGEVVYLGYPSFNKKVQNYLPNIIKNELDKM